MSEPESLVGGVTSESHDFGRSPCSWAVKVKAERGRAEVIWMCRARNAPEHRATHGSPCSALLNSAPGGRVRGAKVRRSEFVGKSSGVSPGYHLKRKSLPQTWNIVCRAQLDPPEVSSLYLLLCYLIFSQGTCSKP